jgi:hypothetical protein
MKQSIAPTRRLASAQALGGSGLGADRHHMAQVDGPAGFARAVAGAVDQLLGQGWRR